MIDFDTIDYYSYLLYHCKIPLLTSLRIHDLEEDVRDGSLEVSFTGPDGQIGHFCAAITMAAGEELVITEQPTIESSLLRCIDTPLQGRITLTLTRPDGTQICQADKPVSLMPARHWMYPSDNPLFYELLTSFVQPNAPAITPLTHRAAEILGEKTGRSAITGYDDEDPKRVDAIVRALYQAVCERTIHYHLPPASWLSGQEVRTPHEVLNEKVGTCLDTAITFASLLEEVGLHPIIWIQEAHALVGYWRDAACLDSVVNTDCATAINHLDVRTMKVFETTLVTRGDNCPTFDEACDIGKKKVREAGEKNLAVIDVITARRGGIFPLPARAVDEDGNTITVTREYTMRPDGKIAPDISTGPIRIKAQKAAQPVRITQWKNALLDLTLRNGLLNFRESSACRLAVPARHLATLEDRVNDGRILRLRDSDDIASIYRKQGIEDAFSLPDSQLADELISHKRVYVRSPRYSYEKALRKLQDRARMIAEESGANNLYLTFGMLKWEINDREVRTPLVLVPVSISTPNRGKYFELTINDAEQSTPNFCLLEKFKSEFDFELTDLKNPPLDDSGIDLNQLFRSIRRKMLDAGLNFTVEPEVHLAILNFSKFRMWRDLDESWQELAKNSLVDHLVNNPTGTFIDPAVPDVDEENAIASPAVSTEVDLNELALHMPLPCDSSQLDAIAAAVDGQTFVLEGPPGTGKSQTIANLLGYAMEKGKRVLFVAEKRAALEVVQKRIADIGLSEKVLELHDKHASGAIVREQLELALEQIEAANSRSVNATSAHYHQALSLGRNLEDFARQIHAENSAKLSLYSAHNWLLTSGASDGLADSNCDSKLIIRPEVLGHIPSFQVDRVKELLPEISPLAGRYQVPAVKKWGRFSSTVTLSVDPDQVLALCTSLKKVSEKLSGAGIDPSLPLAAYDRNQADKVMTFLAQPKYSPASIAAFTSVAQPDLTNAVNYALANQSIDQRQRWLQYFTPEILDTDLPALFAQAQAVENAGFFARFKLRKELAREITPYIRPGIATPKGHELCAALYDAGEYARIRFHVRQVLTKAGFENLSTTGIITADIYVGSDGKISHSVQAGATHFDLRKQNDALLLLTCPGFDEQLAAALHQLRQTPHADELAREINRYFTDVDTLLSGIERRVDQPSIDDTSDRVSAKEVIDILATDVFSTLEQALAGELTIAQKMADYASQVKRLGFPEIAHTLLKGEVNPNSLIFDFEYALARAGFVERSQNQGLIHFSAKNHDAQIASYRHELDNIRRKIPRILPTVVSRNAHINANSRHGQVGNLKHEIARQRGRKKIRELFEEYGPLIMQITPCVLMSPSSVAQFLPVKADLFDIVIFDEASQIRVCDAIGSIGRARSVVVVGDSKQMPPSSTFTKTAEIDEETAQELGSVADVESILSECTSSQVHRRWLTWHYRSQNEALIAFSNNQYYNGKLSTFPTPENAAQANARHNVSARISVKGLGTPGVHFVRVDGHFERERSDPNFRTNEIEAQAIVEEIEARFSRGQSISIGVVTLNIQQKELIETMLRDHKREEIANALDEPDGLFVKNLENVQGDERDVIFFSIGFSKNERGVVPLNFGPLNNVGGERRLNVAITRARREVRIFCSFSPDDLHAERSSTQGLRDLKNYLVLASRGERNLAQLSRRHSDIDPHREDIATQLRERGLVVNEEVGMSYFRIDLTVAHKDAPDAPLIAVMLDNRAWASRRTVIDRDVLPDSVLSGLMGWPEVHRIWLLDWVANKEKILDAFLTRVNELHEERQHPSPDHLSLETIQDFDGDREEPFIDSAVSADESEQLADGYIEEISTYSTPEPAPAPAVHIAGAEVVDEPSNSEDPPAPKIPSSSETDDGVFSPNNRSAEDAASTTRWGIVVAYFEEWVPAFPQVEVGASQRGDHRPLKNWIGDALVEIVKNQGPTRFLDAAKTLNDLIYGRRFTERQQNFFRNNIHAKLREDKDGFLWLRASDPLTHRTVRRPHKGERRDIASISIEELACFLNVAATRTGGTDRDGLFKETSELLGYKSLSGVQRTRCKQALEKASEMKIIELVDGFYHPSKPPENF